jgi:peptidoglycan/xylan/chitin deacetylase (PgdA/CDA1 family)
MEVGDHTWNHPHLPSISSDSASNDVSRTRKLLRNEGAEVALFRAPYGEIRADELSLIEHSGLRAIHWSIAVDHYVGGLALSPAEAGRALIEEIRPGDIILAHDAHLLAQDGGGDRAAAMGTLERLVPELRARGFAITTVSHLLTAGTPVYAKPRIWFWQSGFYCP